jgi:hypothetical protein
MALMMLILCGTILLILFTFLGYRLGVAESTKEIGKIVGKDVNKIKDLSFDNFKSVIESDYKEEDYDPDFTIEHYPESQKYYPKYKKNYLKKDYHSGIVMVEERMRWADSRIHEKDALRLIELFKEQKLKKNMKTIRVKR